MLYDNGPLLQLYAQAALATGDPLFRRIAGETADWMVRDMQSPQGGFWSALDADSEGHEGKFYVWDESDVRAQLNTEQYAVFAHGSDSIAQPTSKAAGTCMCIARSRKSRANSSMAEPRAQQLLDEARTQLLALRAARVWPGARRENTHRLERPRDHRDGDRGAGAGACRSRASCTARHRFHPHALLARPAVTGCVQGRTGALSRLPG